MLKNKENTIQYIVLAIIAIALPLSLLKKPRKDWIIVFFLKGFISSIIALVAVSHKWMEFPRRLLQDIYESSILFDYIVFPALCVWYNQTTYNSKLKGIILQAFVLYSLPMTVLEWWLEKNTNLIKYNKWTWMHTYLSLAITFLFVRGFMAVVRRFSDNRETSEQVNAKGSR
ncbi:CBO0543 family protein [Desulfuribacillus alkaliarsenatis]|uniref:Uncharacterized protein n=1 Tax=Desulfuribacillus alkaliarsenatis TaxID=766136 RepID=A0A1E5G2D1_9FIRM|nr:CBO0543 family protein [Desulfuribacillus alkaliarsenatis]OEF97094.1 hypothetical protein BHF68_05710 [Desulfuribacillus alkaliarsenatis]